MKKGMYYVLVGVFFVLLQVVAIVRNYYWDFVFFFWFCDFIPLVLAVAFFFKKHQLVKGIVNIGLIPQIIYMLGFFMKVFFGVSFLDEVNLLFLKSFLIILSTVFLHSATIFAFVLTHRVRPNKFSLVYSFVGLVLIYLTMIIFTDPVDSINYVYLFSNYFGSIFLSILWIPATFLVVVLPTYFLQYFIWKKFGAKKMKK